MEDYMAVFKISWRRNGGLHGCFQNQLEEKWRTTWLFSKSVGGEMEDYIKCELIGGVSPGHLNSFSNLFIVGLYATHRSPYVMYCAMVDYTVLSTTKYRNIIYLLVVLHSQTLYQIV